MQKIVTHDLCSRAIAYVKAVETDALAESIPLSRLDSPVHQLLDNGLGVFYVVDTGDQLQYVQQRHLEASSWDSSVLHRTALQNLAELAGAKMRIQPYGNVFAVFLDGNFEASLILVDDIWDNAISHLAPHGFVAALPARDMLAFCDAGSPQGIDELRQIVGRLKDGDHLLRKELFRRKGGQWLQWS